MNRKLGLRPSIVAAAFAALFAGSDLPRRHPPARTPAPRLPPNPRSPNRTSRSPATSGIFSQYMFRGISQTNEKPAVQGGFDLRTRAASMPARGVEHQLDLATARPTHPPASNGTSTAATSTTLPTTSRRPGHALLLLPGQLPAGLHNAEHDRALRRAQLEDAAGEVQLQRQQQDVRHPRFARQLLHRGQPQLGRRRQGQRLHRQDHDHRPRRPPELPEQQQRHVHRLEGRRGLRPVWATRSASSAREPTRRARSTPTDTARTPPAAQFVAYVQKTF